MNRAAIKRGLIASCVCGGLAVPGAAAVAAGDMLANPASLLCRADGATVVIESAPNGSQRGVCVFPSGERINEWAYFRNKNRTKQ